MRPHNCEITHYHDTIKHRLNVSFTYSAAADQIFIKEVRVYVLEEWVTLREGNAVIEFIKRILETKCRAYLLSRLTGFDEDEAMDLIRLDDSLEEETE